MSRNVYVKIADPEIQAPVLDIIGKFFIKHNIVESPNSADSAIVDAAELENPEFQKSMAKLQALCLYRNGTMKDQQDSENIRFRPYGGDTGIRDPGNITFYFLLSIGNISPYWKL
jgi:hypothetical protein